VARFRAASASASARISSSRGASPTSTRLLTRQGFPAAASRSPGQPFFFLPPQQFIKRLPGLVSDRQPRRLHLRLGGRHAVVGQCRAGFTYRRRFEQLRDSDALCVAARRAEPRAPGPGANLELGIRVGACNPSFSPRQDPLLCDHRKLRVVQFDGGQSLRQVHVLHLLRQDGDGEGDCAPNCRGHVHGDEVKPGRSKKMGDQVPLRYAV